MKDKDKSKSQSLDTVKIDFNQIPEYVLKDIGLTILQALKNDKEIQDRYERETGKSVFKKILP